MSAVGTLSAKLEMSDFKCIFSSQDSFCRQSNNLIHLSNLFDPQDIDDVYGMINTDKYAISALPPYQLQCCPADVELSKAPSSSE